MQVYDLSPPFLPVFSVFGSSFEHVALKKLAETEESWNHILIWY